MFQQYPRLFSKFHREVFCWIDQWHGLTMADIRAIEERTQKELEEVVNFLIRCRTYGFRHGRPDKCAA